MKWIKNILFFIIILNVMSTFFRYTEIYLLFSPKWIMPIVYPYYWNKNWSYSLLLKSIPESIDQIPTKVAVLTDPYDFYYAEFNLFPRRAFRMDEVPPSLNSPFEFLLIHKKFKVKSSQLSGWVLFQDTSGIDFQVWKRRQS